MNRLFLVLVLLSHTALSADLQLKSSEQSIQFISYWKSQVVTAEQDERVVVAEQIYARLLRAWDSSRLEPGLYVVDSESGPWAASLVDGNILLSLNALKSINSFGAQRAEHLLAFVLAHELAHQRADDLWQHRFFRINQNELDFQQLEIQIDKRALADMELKEARADHDGLILMSTVGFNPYLIVGKKDFFTEWVENIWQQPCQSQQDKVLSDACLQAKKRALRTHSQLDLVASQSSLYDLGVQALVANNYDRARFYFTQYGRDFPNRAVMSALGLSHLAEAIQIHKKLIQQGVIDSPDFFYPLLLDASAGAESINDSGLKRAGVESYVQSQRKKIDRLVEQAVFYFEKAIRLQPEHKNSYLALASAYLLTDNSFLVRGVLQGKYIPRFGKDSVSAMMLAMTDALEGKPRKAINDLRKIMDSRTISTTNHVQAMPDDLMSYSVIYNLSVMLSHDGQKQQAIQAWKKFAQRVQSEGNAYLFQLALGHLQNIKVNKKAVLKQSPTVNGLRLGNKKTRDDSGHSINELWIEGEQFHVYNYYNGAQFITGENGRIISARQQSGAAIIEGKLKQGDDADRPLKTLGLPDRRIHLAAGEYLAYDQYGLALHIDDNKVKGWFLY